jgi:hypothetical protein
LLIARRLENLHQRRLGLLRIATKRRGDITPRTGNTLAKAMKIGLARHEKNAFCCC